MEFHIEKSRLIVKYRFKESKSADVSHSFNRDFTVYKFSTLRTHMIQMIECDKMYLQHNEISLSSSVSRL